MNELVSKYAASIVWFAVGILIIVFQLAIPDIIPELVTNLIERDNSNFVGLDFTLKAFLLFYTISGAASLLVGIVTAFITYKR